MAFVLGRQSGPESTLCWDCHQDVWFPLAGLRGLEAAVRRVHEKADHVSEVELTIGWCVSCEGARCCAAPVGAGRGSRRRVRLYFTPEELSTMFKGMAPGVVTGAPQASRQANGHLAALRAVKVHQTAEECALLEMLPFVAACLAVDRRYAAGWRGTCCGCTVPGSIAARRRVSLEEARTILRTPPVDKPAASKVAGPPGGNPRSDTPARTDTAQSVASTLGATAGPPVGGDGTNGDQVGAPGQPAAASTLSAQVPGTALATLREALERAQAARAVPGGCTVLGDGASIIRDDVAGEGGEPPLPPPDSSPSSSVSSALDAGEPLPEEVILAEDVPVILAPDTPLPSGPPVVLGPAAPPLGIATRATAAASAPPGLPTPAHKEAPTAKLLRTDSTFVSGWGLDAQGVGRTADEIDQLQEEEKTDPSITLERLVLGGQATLLVDASTAGDPNSRPLAVQMGGVPPTSTHFANSLTNARRALLERQIKPYTELILSQAEREELISISEAFTRMLATDGQVDDILATLLFGNWRSRKWTVQRAEKGLEELMKRYDPHYNFSGSIKLEAGKNGKPPRLIVADGDAGQIMAWVVIGTLERALVKRYKVRTIKGVSKSDRMKKLVKDLQHFHRDEKGDITRRLESTILENDGSAWDACCSQDLRDMTENILIDHIMERMKPYIMPESLHAAAHDISVKTKVYKLAFKPSRSSAVCWTSLAASANGDELIHALLKKQVKHLVAAVRRSGHRGTSILNWIINQILWVWVIFGAEGAAFAAPNKLRAKDIYGIVRYIKMCFEGDDSILSLTESVTKAMVQGWKDRWIKLGHRPKLYARKPGDCAEFCGWKFLCDQFGLVEDECTPDAPRQFKNGHTTHAQEAVAFAVQEDKAAFAKAVVPGILARAYTLAEKTPILAQYFLTLAEKVNGGCIGAMAFDAESLYQVGRNPEAHLPEFWKADIDVDLFLSEYKNWQEITTMVKSAVSAGLAIAADAEPEFAVRQGWVKSVDEYTRFIEVLTAGVACSQAAPIDLGDLPEAFR